MISYPQGIISLTEKKWKSFSNTSYLYLPVLKGYIEYYIEYFFGELGSEL